VKEQAPSISGVTFVAATILERSNLAALCFLTLRNGAEFFLELGVLQMFNKYQNFYVTQLFIIFYSQRLAICRCFKSN